VEKVCQLQQWHWKTHLGQKLSLSASEEADCFEQLLTVGLKKKKEGTKTVIYEHS